MISSPSHGQCVACKLVFDLPSLLFRFAILDNFFVFICLGCDFFGSNVGTLNS